MKVSAADVHSPLPNRLIHAEAPKIWSIERESLETTLGLVLDPEAVLAEGARHANPKRPKELSRSVIWRDDLDDAFPASAHVVKGLVRRNA